MCNKLRKSTKSVQKSETATKRIVKGNNCVKLTSAPYSLINFMPGLHSHRDSTRWDWKCEGYIRLACHILNLFFSSRSSRKDFGKSVPSQRKQEYFNFVSYLSHKSVNSTFVHTFVSFTSHRKSRWVSSMRV